MQPRPGADMDEEEQGFLQERKDVIVPTRKPGRSWGWYFRLGLDIVMVVTILALLSRPYVETKIKPTPVPVFPQKTYMFLENKTMANENMFATEEALYHTMYNWIDFSAYGRGYVVIDDYKKYDLPEPYTVYVTRDTEGPAFMMTVFHQLHCLSYLIHHFQRGFAGGNLSQEEAHHSAHCVDYIRQGIMCAADTSLEGNSPAGPGWGSKHQCKDYSAVLDWANKHSAYRFHRGPEGDIL